MKKIFFACCMLLVLNAFAQDETVEFGVRGGLNLNSTSYEGVDYAIKTRHDFHWGVFGLKMFNEDLGMLGELQYSKKGGFINDEKFVLHYLALQPMALYDFNGIFNIQAGMELAWLLNADYPGTSSLKDNFNNFDYSVVLGAGMVLWRLRMDLKYLIGLTNVSDKGIPELPTKMNNRTFQVSLGYRIN